MRFPMAKEILGKIKAGELTQACVPIRVPGEPKVGDKVIFSEATFNQHGVETFVPVGDSLSVILTRVEAQTSTIFFLEWNAVSEP